jgi:hypothetical protein
VLVGDGWVKDGDLNTTFGKTVLPLPYHGRQDYTIPPRGLENDPVYRRFPGTGKPITRAMSRRKACSPPCAAAFQHARAAAARRAAPVRAVQH